MSLVAACRAPLAQLLYVVLVVADDLGLEQPHAMLHLVALAAQTHLLRHEWARSLNNNL